MDKNRVTGVEGFDIPIQTDDELLEDSEIYYFYYKSYPEQILRKNVLCYECDEDIEWEYGETPDIGEECPSCGEPISEYSESDIDEFFDFDENEGIENAPAGSLFNYFAVEYLDDNGKPGAATATATIFI